MAVTINGTTGVAVPLGTASTPGVVNTTSSTTGIYNPASTTLALATNGTQAVYVDASQNVGVGTSSTGAGYRVSVVGSAASSVPLYLHSDATNGYVYSPNPLVIGSTGAYALSLVTNNTTQMTIASSGIITGTAGNLMLVQGTAQASTSGTSITFTGIPSWVKRITVMLNGVSVTGSSYVLVQIGSGSTTTSGYVGSGTNTGTGSAASIYTLSYTNAFGMSASSPGTGNYNIIGTLANISGNNWIWSCVGNDSGSAVGLTGAGKIALGGVLDRVVFAASTSSSTMSGTDTFDAGTINIQYE
jgi:hypothetical protein